MTETMRAAKSEYTRYSLLVGTLMILSVGDNADTMLS